MSYTLYFAPDNASLIVRILLNEIGAEYSCVLVDRKQNGQKSQTYLSLNPNGLIPVLETPDGAIFETGAILLWLADRHKTGFPDVASPLRASALKWLFFLSNTVHPTLRMLFYPDKYAPVETTSVIQSSMQNHLLAHLAILNQELSDRDWFCADAPSALDMYLCTLIRWMQLYPIARTDWFSLDQFPNLHRLAKTLERRRSVLDAAQSEGLGACVFSNPTYATPPIGSAT